MYSNFGIELKFEKIIQKEKKRSARKSFRIINYMDVCKYTSLLYM